MFKAESQGPEKHLAYKVKSHFAKQQLKAKCLERKNIEGKEVLARIEYSRDLTVLTFDQPLCMKTQHILDA